MTKELSIGDERYRIRSLAREGGWVAFAERSDSGDRFGIECVAATEPEAVRQLAQWLEWQHEHAVALEALQQTERAYHRTIAGSAFANPTEGPTSIELQRESLEDVEAARVRLDETRLRRPL
jgi:hypothetical protein